jgi:murein DD-endopeptidase MepM/ murein hydrolase activator NlpD
VSIVVSASYWYVFDSYFGSPKEKLLTKQLDNMKLQYSLLGREIGNMMENLNSLKLSDEKRYRPILEMDSIAGSFRKGGVGGVERFSDLKRYENAGLMISFRTMLEEIKNMANVQKSSFEAILAESMEWKRENDHMPAISPVSVKFQLGDGYVFRAIHPVLGTSRMHNGQDFRVPFGTEVYATGDGVVEEAGFSSGGFGNYIVIDHDYGFQSLYGHLSRIKVTKGMNVKRGDLIGISGDTGLSSGPHLHYQIEQRGKAVNPSHYLNNEMNLEEYNEMIQLFGAKSSFR